MVMDGCLDHRFPRTAGATDGFGSGAAYIDTGGQLITQLPTFMMVTGKRGACRILPAPAYDSRQSKYYILNMYFVYSLAPR